MNGHYLPDGVADPIRDEFGLGVEYWDAAREERLVVQRCTSCRGWQWTPELVCSRCHSEELGYDEVGPRGTLYSFTRIWHPVDPGLVESVPYLVAVVQLDDVPEVMMIGNLLGDPLVEPTIGSACEAVFEHHDEFTLVQWRATS